MRLLPLLAAALALAAAAPAEAYWEFGHQTIAAIAMKNVRPVTARRVRALLAHSGDLDTPTCPARTPEQASVWADCRASGRAPRTNHLRFAARWPEMPAGEWRWGSAGPSTVSRAS